jgi:hypothetical protein
MSELEQLQNEEQKIKAALYDNRARQREILTAQFISETGINIGDRVKWMDGHKEVHGQISEVVYYAGIKPSAYKAFKLKSDGTVGRVETRIWGKPEKL